MHIDTPIPLLYCNVTDPDPPWEQLKLPEGGTNKWLLVDQVTIPASLNGNRRRSVFCERNWLYLVIYPTVIAGKPTRGAGRAGKLKRIPDDQRTAAGLATISANKPKQEFAIWWELCNTKPQVTEKVEARKKKKAAEKKQKAK